MIVKLDALVHRAVFVTIDVQCLQVLHSGEGPIHAVAWRTSLISWANDLGVKVYDAASDQRVTFIERPRGSPHPELLLPHLVWQVVMFVPYVYHFKS